MIIRRKSISIVLSVIVSFLAIVTFLKLDRKDQITSQGIDIKKFIGIQGIPNKFIEPRFSIAIIDSGFEPNDYISNNRILKFVDLINNNTQLYDDYGHGTKVAELIGGNNCGINNKCNLVIIKALDKFGQADRDTLVSALEWVSNNADNYNIKIVNISAGVEPIMPFSKDPLFKSINNLYNKDVLLIASSGNSYEINNKILAPAIFPQALAVGSIEKNSDKKNEVFKLADFSLNRYESLEVSKPDIYTFGVNISSPNRNNTDDIKYVSGTSYSTAIVTGVVSLMLEDKPKMKIDDITNIMYKNCVILDNKVKVLRLKK